MNMKFTQLALLILISFLATSQENQTADLEFAYNGIWESGEIVIDPEITCLDVRNGTLASFKIILLINNGTSVKQFDEVGKCFSEKALKALTSAPAGTQVMFSQMKQVTEGGGRKEIKGKNYLIKK